MEQKPKRIFMEEKQVLMMLGVLLELLERIFTEERLRGMEALAQVRKISESVHALDDMRKRDVQ